MLAFTRCNSVARAAEWEVWYDETRLPDLICEGGPWVATRWRVPDPPAPGRPSIGFTHVTLYDVAGASPAEAVERSLAILPRIHAAGRWLDCHAGGMAFTLEPTGIHGATGIRA